MAFYCACDTDDHYTERVPGVGLACKCKYDGGVVPTVSFWEKLSP